MHCGGQAAHRQQDQRGRLGDMVDSEAGVSTFHGAAHVERAGLDQDAERRDRAWQSRYNARRNFARSEAPVKDRATCGRQGYGRLARVHQHAGWDRA